MLVRFSAMGLENGKTLLLGLWPQNEGIVVVPLSDRFCGWILPNTHALRPKAWCTSTGLAGRCQWRNAFGGTLMPPEAEERMPPVNSHWRLRLCAGLVPREQTRETTGVAGVRPTAAPLLCK